MGSAAARAIERLRSVGRPPSAPGDTLTARQQEILDFVRSEIHRQGYAPSVREIMAQFGIASTNGVTDHLLALERKGAIRWDRRAKSRAIVVLVGPCPMCGGAR